MNPALNAPQPSTLQEEKTFLAQAKNEFTHAVDLLGSGKKEDAKRCFEETLKTINKALVLDENLYDAWELKAVILINLVIYKEALEAAKKALEIEQKCYLARAILVYLYVNQPSIRKYVQGKDLSYIQTFWQKDDDFLGLTNSNILGDCNQSELESINFLWASQYYLLDLLRSEQEEVAHYTSRPVLERLLTAKEEKDKDKYEPLKLCSVAAANDKAEGKAFLSLLEEEIKTETLLSREKMLVLQASFSSEIDCLNQFRLYGKEEGKEGTGACLVFNQRFFTSFSEGNSFIQNLSSLRDEREALSHKEKAPSKLPLYWVLYCDCRERGEGEYPEIYYSPTSTAPWMKTFKDPKKQEEVDEEVKAIKTRYQEIVNVLREIREEYKKLKESKNPELQQMALDMLIYLRHLVKDAAFKEEKELRILSLHPFKSSSQEENSRPVSLLESKGCLACDYLPIFHREQYLKKIIMGPNVVNVKNHEERLSFYMRQAPWEGIVPFEQSRAPLS